MAKDMNTFFFIGRQTRDIDANAFGYLNNGTARLNLSLACNGIKKDASGNWIDDVSYFDVTVWGRQAETLKDYIGKGKQLAVRGHMQQQRWQDDAGNNHSKLALIAEDVQLLRDANSQRNNDGYQQQPQQQQYTQQYQQPQQQPSQYAQQYQQQQQPAQVAAVENAFKGQVVQQQQQPNGYSEPPIF